MNFELWGGARIWNLKQLWGAAWRTVSYRGPLRRDPRRGLTGRQLLVCLML